MATAGQLLTLYSLRLGMSRDGIVSLAPFVRLAIESLVEKLETLNPNDEVKIDADLKRHPVAIFIRVATGEVLGEIDQPPEIGTMDIQ